MSDVISRHAAIDAMNAKLEDIKLRWRGKVKKGEIAMYLDMRGTIETLPSAQPEQRWIPCSERLPKTDNEVLITVFDTEDDYVEVYKGFYQDHEWWTQWCHGCLKIKDEPCGVNIVTAWMPLPEPYKGGEQDG